MMIVWNSKSSLMLLKRKKIRSNIFIVRKMGGFITDYDLTVYAFEVYRDLNGEKSIPTHTFVIPNCKDDIWPEHLKGKPLGSDIRKHGLIKYDVKSIEYDWKNKLPKSKDT